MKDKLNITLNVAGEILDLTIPAGEEQMLRRAAAEVNDVLTKWKRNFQDKTEHHVLTRVTLLFARGYLAQRQANEAVDNVLDQLEQSLDKMLAGEAAIE